MHTPIHIIDCFEYKLSLALDLVYSKQFYTATSLPADQNRILLDAIKHQNIIGWDLFIRGFTSSKWIDVFNAIRTYDCRHRLHWDVTLISGVLTLLKGILDDCNRTLHGATRIEAAQKLWERVLQRTRELYSRPPKLHPRYAKITTISADERMKRSTMYLMRWLARGWSPH